MKHKDLQVHHFKIKSAFYSWLQNNREQTESIWLKIAKKNTGGTSLSYEEAREVAICWGWIDGLANKLDEQYYLLKLSKRRPRSMWSKINRNIAEMLIKSGDMQSSGLQQVERAKQDGRWESAYDSPKDMNVPNWFIKLLKEHKTAYDFYCTLNKSSLYNIAYNLRTAKREDTKQRRAEKFLKMLKEKRKP